MESPSSAEEDTGRSRMADGIRDRNCVTAKDKTFLCKFVVKYFVVTLLLKYMAVCNRWTGLWTGSVDWIAGLDCWIQPNCHAVKAMMHV